MKKHGLLFVVLFLTGLTISMNFQSCGSSTMQANDSNGDGGLQVQVIPDGPKSEDNGNNPDADFEFAFDFANGDNIFYQTFNSAINVLSTVRLSAKSYYNVSETHIYESSDITISVDLPQNYCNNSALPHCAHLNPFVCLGFGCFEGPTPVRCHWQKRMTGADRQNTFPVINNLVFFTREVTATDPMMEGCNNPTLSYFKENDSILTSLASRACVPEGMLYASSETGTDMIDVFSTEIDAVALLTNNNDDPELCNNYSIYSWDTTKFTYQSRSGFVPANQSYFYEASYENLRIDLRWKAANDPNTYCATDVPIQPSDLSTLFPSDGFTYYVFRTQNQVVDLPTVEITYEDPVDGGSEWRFFLTRGSALTNRGGAVMNDAQSQALQQMIENTLTVRAGAFNLVTTCN